MCLLPQSQSLQAQLKPRKLVKGRYLPHRLCLFSVSSRKEGDRPVDFLEGTVPFIRFPSRGRGPYLFFSWCWNWGVSLLIMQPAAPQCQAQFLKCHRPGLSLSCPSEGW